jgi:hypothetical protein
MHVKLLYSLVARACLTKTSTTPQCCFSFQYTVPYELVFSVYTFILRERFISSCRLYYWASTQKCTVVKRVLLTPWRQSLLGIRLFLLSVVTPSLYQLLPRRAFSSEAFWQKCRHVESGTDSTWNESFFFFDQNEEVKLLFVDAPCVSLCLSYSCCCCL